ncbi:hypothetical protein EAMG_05315 [Escherichia coli M056]|uniref:hypothetical protein n=1 Tax=Escherichia coli TaxID=562 RepID=UPI000A189410|nr:hypothetical protein [Escherichia coli]OSK14535.1 hypothetical protein EAMG_05315 [Escherichia coli M056]
MNNERTKQNALLVELLGDVGQLHDQIKSLPVDLQQAIHESLKIVALAVEETENTAKTVLSEFRTEMERSAEAETDKFKKSLSNTIDETLNNKLKDCSESIDQLKHKAENLSEYVRDKKGHTITIFLCAICFMISLLAFGSLYLIFDNNQKQAAKENLYLRAYQTNNEVMKRMPPTIQKQFREEREKFLKESEKHGN